MKSNEPLNDMENNSENENISAHEPEIDGSQPDPNDEILDPIAKLEAELIVSQDKYLRIYSEFENYKKRISRDRIDQIKMAGSDIFLSIIPIIDDMDRAIKSIEKSTDVNAIKEGIQLIYSKLKATTESKGLKPMNAIGKVFDVDLHDAITNVTAPTEDLKGKVIDEVEKGYFLNDKVIRHAKVIVGN